ncbi:hypothetical protein C2G38_2232719 [Gigaspora rosea]|uniref:Uncharacterized protein n=1 Tax=Gigaspora rosea TaxID=44941 RepID=A0A397TS57_9GLOM|nr:hypothetical protein C2G38_2232719 [Gigaspora rosea]
MTKIFYKREHVEKEASIYDLDEMQRLFQEIEPSLKDFFDQLYLVARPLECNEQTMEHSVGTSNEGLNTLINFGTSITSRAVNYKKRRMSDVHGEYVERALAKHSENECSSNPCPILAILCNGAINPKIVDDRLIIKHLDESFIVNFGIPYHDCNWYSKEKCSDEEFVDRLTVHSYDNRLEEKRVVKKNINALLTSLMKEEKNPIKDNSKNIIKDDSKIDEVTDDSKTVKNSLERATELFLKS